MTPGMTMDWLEKFIKTLFPFKIPESIDLVDIIGTCHIQNFDFRCSLCDKKTPLLRKLIRTFGFHSVPPCCTGSYFALRGCLHPRGKAPTQTQ